MKYGFDGDKLERVICDLLGLDPPSVPAASKMTKLMLPLRNVINLKKTGTGIIQCKKSTEGTKISTKKYTKISTKSEI